MQETQPSFDLELSHSSHPASFLYHIMWGNAEKNNSYDIGDFLIIVQDIIYLYITYKVKRYGVNWPDTVLLFKCSHSTVLLTFTFSVLMISRFLLQNFWMNGSQTGWNLGHYVRKCSPLSLWGMLDLVQGLAELQIQSLFIYLCAS